MITIGGKKIYTSTKVSTGSWIDDQGGPAYYNRGFTTSGYISESQYQQDKKFPKSSDIIESRYGSAINDIHDKNTTSQSVNTLLHETKSDANLFLPTTKREMDSTIDFINQNRNFYSKSPTNLGTTSKTISKRSTGDRFLTETKRSLLYSERNVKIFNRYPFHGTPGPLESYRSQLVKKNGLLALSVLRTGIGGEGCTMTCHEMTNRLRALVPPEFNKAYINQIVAYFSAVHNISTDSILRLTIGRLEGFPTSNVENFFHSICLENDLFDIKTLPISAIVDKFKSVNSGSETNNTLSKLNLEKHLLSYEYDQNDTSSSSTSTLSQVSFIKWHEDMFSSDPIIYFREVAPLFNE